MPRPVIAFDMETVGVDWDDLDEKTRSYLIDRATRRMAREGRTGSAEAVARDGLGLSPGTGRIIAIGLSNPESGQGALLYEGDGGWSDAEDGTRVFRGDEPAMLEEFWQLMERYGRVITYNGRGFDIPYSYIRSALHGIKPSRQLLGNRFSIADHCDLAEVLTFFGAAQERFSLDYWCRRFDISSPKAGGIDGSQVNDFYRQGKLEEIAWYCLRDAVATGELYRLLEENLIDLYARRR